MLGIKIFLVYVYILTFMIIIYYLIKTFNEEKKEEKEVEKEVVFIPLINESTLPLPRRTLYCPKNYMSSGIFFSDN